jgi:hypothetical protein
MAKSMYHINSEAGRNRDNPPGGTRGAEIPLVFLSTRRIEGSPGAGALKHIALLPARMEYSCHGISGLPESFPRAITW